MIRVLLILSLTLSAAVASAQETQPTEQPPETQPVESNEMTVESDVESDAPDPDDGFTLAVDPTLIPEHSNETKGGPLSKKRDTPTIGPKRKLTLLEGLAWIPRVVFYPVYLVTEYVIRWPLGVATVWVEKNHVINRFIEFTSFDDDRGRITPRIQIYSGFSPSFGLNITWADMFLEGNDWSVGADAGFNRNLTVEAATRYRFWDDDASVTLRYALEKRNDYLFHGIGADTFEEDESRFFRVKNGGELGLKINRMSSGFGARTSVEINDYSFDCSNNDDDDLCGDDNQVNTPDDRLPIDSDGSANFFTSGYQILRYKGLVYWDSREERPASGTGLRFEGFGRVGQSLGDDNIQFVRYGGEAAGFLDVFNQRVVGLRVNAELAKPIGDGEIPFGELILLGGIESMRGFRTGRFHGLSSLVTTLDYRFPVWSFFDGNLFFEAGNVFGDSFEDFSPEKLRPSVGLSLKTINSRYNAIDLTFALGGTRFDAQPIAVESVSIGLGTNFGF